MIEEFNHHLHHKSDHESVGGLCAHAAMHTKLRNCGVIESRVGEGDHPIALREHDFEMEPPGLNTFRARAGQLPEQWSRVMLAPGKAWRSPSHAGARCALGAWQWLMQYEGFNWGEGERPLFFSAWQAKLAEPAIILHNTASGNYFFVFGASLFSLLTWRLALKDGVYDFIMQEDALEPQFIYDHSTWLTIPYRPLSPEKFRLEHGVRSNRIALQATGPPQPLLHLAAEAGKLSALTKGQLTLVLRCMDIEPVRGKKTDLLLQVGATVWPDLDDEELRKRVNCPAPKELTKEEKSEALKCRRKSPCGSGPPRLRGHGHGERFRGDLEDESRDAANCIRSIKTRG